MAGLGRFPFFIKAITKMIKYYARIKNMAENSLIGHALLDMKQRTGTWERAANNIINCLGLNINQIRSDIRESEHKKKKVSKVILGLIENRYKESWEIGMRNQKGKLDTYKLFKSDFGYESYLDKIRVGTHQKAMTKLRISNHKLHIETGRYKKPVTPRHERLCELCSEGIEDEFHFLFTCKELVNIRKQKFTDSRHPMLLSVLAEFTVPLQYAEAAMSYRQTRLTGP